MGPSPGRQHHCSTCKLDPSDLSRKQGENQWATVQAHQPTKVYLRPVPFQRTSEQANGSKATNTGSIRAQGRAIRRLPQKNVFLGSKNNRYFFWSKTGLRREGAIPCHVASKNIKGNSCVPFVLEGVTDQGHLGFAGRTKKGFRKNKLGIGA